MKSIKLIIVALAMSLTSEASAQEKIKNPFGLVYADALSSNQPGKVQIHPVNYPLNGINIAANVYTPADYDPSKSYPTIVLAHPNGGVKEQVAGLYAQRFAERGYITITADAAYQGASGGFPRNTDKPANRIEDIRGMTDYISSFKAVDPNRIAVFGICGGGGYTLKAAQSDKRLKAVATLSMFNSGLVRRNGFLDAQVASISDRLKAASQARAQEAAGGEVIYLGTDLPTDAEIEKIPTDLYREGFTYYQRSHAHPNSSFRYTMSSLMDLMTFDVNTQMELLDQPLLMIAGDKADSYYMTEQTYNLVSNSKHKELYLIKGATHIQTYWKPEYVKQAVDKAVQFYTEYLK